MYYTKTCVAKDVLEWGIYMLTLLTDSESYIFQIYVWEERDCSYIFNIIFGCEKNMIHFSNYIE